jgi:hypothetical protein
MSLCKSNFTLNFKFLLQKSNFPSIQSSCQVDVMVERSYLNSMSLLGSDSTSQYFNFMKKRINHVWFIGNKYDFFQAESCFYNLGFCLIQNF